MARSLCNKGFGAIDFLFEIFRYVVSQFLSYENRAGGSMLLHPFQFVPAASSGIEFLCLLLKVMLGLLIILLPNCSAALCAFNSTQVGPLLSSEGFSVFQGSPLHTL